MPKITSTLLERVEMAVGCRFFFVLSPFLGDVFVVICFLPDALQTAGSKRVTLSCSRLMAAAVVLPDTENAGRCTSHHHWAAELLPALHPNSPRLISTQRQGPEGQTKTVQRDRRRDRHGNRDRTTKTGRVHRSVQSAHGKSKCCLPGRTYQEAPSWCICHSTGTPAPLACTCI